MLTAHQAVSLIEAETSLKISSIKPAGAGMHNTAYLVNGLYIFRFPKTQDDKQKAKKEAVLLPIIQPLLPLAVPAPEYVSPTYLFIGHKKLTGTFLTKEIYEALPLAKQTALLRSLAHFLTALHNINNEALSRAEAECINFKAMYREECAQIKKSLFPHLNADEQQAIEARFASYFGKEKNFDYKPVLLHNDFSLDHILLDEHEQTLKAVIDFGDAAIGDPDYDLFYLYKELGEEFLSGLLRHYKHSSLPLLFDKLSFFAFAEALNNRVRHLPKA